MENSLFQEAGTKEVERKEEKDETQTIKETIDIDLDDFFN